MVVGLQMCRTLARPGAAHRGASVIFRSVRFPAHAARQSTSYSGSVRIVRCFAEIADEPKVVKVKRPGSAYSMYVKDNYSRVQSGLVGGDPGTTVFKEIGKEWTGLPDEEKDAYKQRASAAMQEHLKLHPEPEKLAKVSKVKKVREPKPKGKMSAYNLYMAQNFSKQDPTISRADRFLAVVAAWKLTSPDERAVYASQAAKLWEDQQSASA